MSDSGLSSDDVYSEEIVSIAVGLPELTLEGSGTAERQFMCNHGEDCGCFGNGCTQEYSRQCPHFMNAELDLPACCSE